MLNLLLESLKEVDPTVALVCTTSYFALRYLIKKIEDFLILFGQSPEPARRKALLMKNRTPKA